MTMPLLVQLKSWRNGRARKEGVEVFRVLPNRALDEIERLRPTTREDLLNIHGIGEKKAEKYGEEILAMTQQTTNDRRQTTGEDITMQKKESGNPTSNFQLPVSDSDFQDVSQKVVSVGEFLDRTNAVLTEMPGAIRGEVSSADIRERYVFFTIKDGEDNASLSVFMWRREYDLCGVRAEEGVEVIVRGRLEVYKPSGRLSFRAHAMELVGEGALKAAYDRLKNALEAEGLFSPDKKRRIREFPHRIGLITSKEGAVIHDFMSNIGRFGFHIAFVNSRVEGALAVAELVGAIRTLKTRAIDVLVIIRGGGSLESLAAFNNETMVREVADFPIPVICGIGHDKDVPLVSLAADVMVSTPTAVTRELNASWERALGRVDILERDILHRFEQVFAEKKNRFQRNAQIFSRVFSAILDRCRSAEDRFRKCFSTVQMSFLVFYQGMNTLQKGMMHNFERALERVDGKLNVSEHSLSQGDPRRQLQLGYGIVSHKERVVRSVKELSAGEEISLLLSDGTVESKVYKVVNKII